MPVATKTEDDSAPAPSQNRSAKESIAVYRNGKLVGSYESTHIAFRRLGLPHAKQFKFRLRMKETFRLSGKSETFIDRGEKYEFFIIPTQTEEQ